MGSQYRLSAALAALLWLGGCGSDDRPALLGTLNTGSSSDSGARGQWCDSLCANARRCQVSVASGCPDNCWRANSNFFAHTSAASLDHQSRCMDQAACPADFDDMLSSCWRDSVDRLEPSDEADAQCEALAPEFFACDWFASRESCTRFHANFSSAALEAERTCAGSTCAELDKCVATQLYGAP
jgi:hypothetical protein